MNAYSILNFIVLYAKYDIYSCNENTIPIDLQNFVIKLKTRVIVEEHRCKCIAN